MLPLPPDPTVSSATQHQKYKNIWGMEIVAMGNLATIPFWLLPTTPKRARCRSRSIFDIRHTRQLSIMYCICVCLSVFFHNCSRDVCNNQLGFLAPLVPVPVRRPHRDGGYGVYTSICTVLRTWGKLSDEHFCLVQMVLWRNGGFPET